MDWQAIILGLRENAGLSQMGLSKQISVERRTIGKYEFGERKPLPEIQARILSFINESGFSIQDIINKGNELKEGILKREKSIAFNLDYSSDLAELIGILIGDGEIHKDGEIRISFDPKKEKNYHKRRLFPLLNNVLGIGKNFYYESEKRISFGNKGFMKYLQNYCNLFPGSKAENEWRIPYWCYNNDKYIASCIRGLFDTDGCCQVNGKRIRISFGRFSRSNADLVKSIMKGLRILKIENKLVTARDGRYSIRIHSNPNVLIFFNSVGSSNPKHISRFLLWRLMRYESKIDIQGLKSIYWRVNRELGIRIAELDIPFFWNKMESHKEYIEKDNNYLEGYELKKKYHWEQILRELFNKVPTTQVAEMFQITDRSVRKWREGTRTPKYDFLPKLFKLTIKNGINVQRYEVNNGNPDNFPYG